MQIWLVGAVINGSIVRSMEGRGTNGEACCLIEKQTRTPW